MEVAFVKTSHAAYTLRCTRADGSATERSLETRSFLAHDLVHFAFEREAKRSASFFGGIAAGSALTDPAPFAGELAVTELIVAPVQSAVKTRATGQEILSGLKDYVAVQGLVIPADVTPELLDRVLSWTRATMRRYDALKTGDLLAFAW